MRNLVLFLDSSLFGGIEAHIVELTNLLLSKKVALSVLFYQDHNNQQLYQALDGLGCKYQFLDGKPTSLFYYLKNQPTSVLHTHGYKAGIIGRVTCKILGIHCVSTYPAGEKGTGRVRIYNWHDQLTSRLSQNLIVSERLREKVKNSEFIANFIVPKNPTLKPLTDSLNIAFVGRLSHEKGPDRFIQLAHAVNNNDNFKYHVFGDGPMKESLKKDPPDNLYFHGHQKKKDFWQSVDVLVICSREEGLPMVLLEAIDNKVLCIANSVGAIDTVIKHKQSGLITENQSISALTSTVKSLQYLSEKERVFLLKNASSRLARFYSGEQQFAQLSTLYFK